MENYAYPPSYPDSCGSSPRSRDIEFENPPAPWDEQSTNNNNNSYRVRFMCSYGGKIHPRPHDNQLSYIGGETKILAVDRNIKFASLVSKLSAICDEEVSFKYQLPGEDLDALISVTNDDDLEHMMHEYDRLFRASPKPARLRLFLFPAGSGGGSGSFLTSAQSFSSNEGRSERERFVDALNSAPVAQSSAPPVAVPPVSNVELLMDLQKGMTPPPPTRIDLIADPVIREPKVTIESDRIQKHIQDLQRLRIGDDNIAGDPYLPKMTEKVPPPTLPGSVAAQMQGSAGYWPESQMPNGVYPATTIATDQTVYMMQAPGGMYHAPMGRPVTGPIGQGYYAVQRMPAEVYREQQVYGVPPPQQPAASQQISQAPQLPPKMAAYSEGIRMVQSTPSGVVTAADTGYAQQVAYDSGMGRQVYYTTQQGAVVAAAAPPQQQQPQYQAMAAATTFSPGMRQAPTFNQEGGKVVPAKIPQASV